MLGLISTIFTLSLMLGVAAKPSYDVVVQSRKHHLYSWGEVQVKVVNASAHLDLLAEHHTRLHMVGVPIDKIVPYKVFVSLASVNHRINQLNGTVYSILNGIVLPSQIYLFISRDSFLLDEGVKEIPEFLLTLVHQKLLTIVFTDNIGPHRKLLPLLAKHYHDSDTLIVTVDDDKSYGEYNSTLLHKLLQGFKATNGTSVVTLGARRIGLCDSNDHRYTQYLSWDYAPYTGMYYSAQWRVLIIRLCGGKTEMLLLPVGAFAVLYRPGFFHPVVFSEQFRNVTKYGDDLTFRLSCMANRVPVFLACRQCRVDVKAVLKGYSNCSVGKLYTNRHDVDSDNHLPSQHHTVDRRLTGGNGTLYQINVEHGGNKEMWKHALEFLQYQRILSNFTTGFVGEYFRERETKCYSNMSHHHHAEPPCAVYHCDAKLLAQYPQGVVVVDGPEPKV